MTSGVNSEQAAMWTAAGRGWAEVEDTVGQMLRPFEDLLVQVAARRPRRRVLDVGCGTGGVTRAIADALGDGTTCVGVDIAETMLAAAKPSENVRFVHADAQVHQFEESFDLIVSRFGVMFFEDPVAAFRNLLRATTPGGELCFVTWRGPDENPFMKTAQQAAARLIPNAPTPAPDAPGPFAFADPDRVRKILGDSGWTGIGISPVDATRTLPVEQLEPYLRNLGPISRALREAPEGERDGILAAVRSAFDPFVHGAEVRIPAACWQVTAQVL